MAIASSVALYHTMDVTAFLGRPRIPGRTIIGDDGKRYYCLKLGILGPDTWI